MKNTIKMRRCKNKQKKTRIKHIMGLIILFVFILNTSVNISTLGSHFQVNNEDGEKQNNYTPIENLQHPKESSTILNETLSYSSSTDLGRALAKRDNEYNTIYEPWKTKAAIHAIAYDNSTGYLALAGGYLYDNEIHIYRLNTETGKFDKVWDSGDTYIEGDVMALAFGDTDQNDFLEIAAASSDGHIYLFEQRHIYDPYTNTENMFDLVWTSPNHFRVFDVKIEDVDRDYRPDIIAGTWDGLYLYEYNNHSNYPFSPEHWITFNEVYHNSLNGDLIYSLETGDFNHNGLPDIVVGTRTGKLYLFENDGITIQINDQPFPLTNDNNYRLNWTSGNYTWMPIIDIASGDLNGDGNPELAVISQGQGVFILEWKEESHTYFYSKVIKDYDSWETGGYWGLDDYVDSAIEATNVEYHDPINTSLTVAEPIEYEWNGALFLPNTSVYPYNTGLAGAPDGNYTRFDAESLTEGNCSIILDLGRDEEGTGSANTEPDLSIYFRYALNESIYEDIVIEISQDGKDFERVLPDQIDYNGSLLRLDLDPSLYSRFWDWYRYIKITVVSGVYDINALKVEQRYNLLTDALSLTIGLLRTNGLLYEAGEPDSNKIVVGTEIGSYIVIGFNSTTSTYDLLWDSAKDEDFKESTGIWDIINIAATPDYPIWKYLYTLNSYVSPTYFSSWTIGRISKYNYDYNDYFYLFALNNKTIIAKTAFFSNQTLMQTELTTINEYLNSTTLSWTSVSMPDLVSPTFSSLNPVVVSQFDPTVFADGARWDKQSGNLIFFYHTSADAAFTYQYTIEDLDLTGEIAELIGTTNTLPETSFVDYDGDGDLDMIFTNGYLYLARNLQAETTTGLPENGNVMFVLERDYFEEVNNKLTSGSWGKAQLIDLNDDGVLDLLVNYGGQSFGAVAFINKGTNEQPQWEKDENLFSNNNPDTNFVFNNLTSLEIIPNHIEFTQDFLMDYPYYPDSYDYTGDFCLIAYNNYTGGLSYFDPKWDAIDSYLIATYPFVYRTDFSLINNEAGGTFKNFGFHIRHSWDTTKDLENWTLSVSFADSDNDGKQEMIIGDYDNNVYVLENLQNNTYKIMYSTPDLYYNESATESPYLYNELEGISGEFTRRIWTHAEHVLANVDLDNDGKKELIVSSGLSLYVFEQKGLTGGDEFQFIQYIDLREHPLSETNYWDRVEKITAMTTADDLDGDGKKELILGVGPFLLVFNILSNYEDFNTHEYFIGSDIAQTRYALIGNPFSGYIDYEISVLTTGDTDNDGSPEILLGGTNETDPFQEDGFFLIYECDGGLFREVWNAPIYVTLENPITDVYIDDQDYDGLPDIIIGHTEGFDIWEYINGTDNDYQRIEYVTSSPNYPRNPLMNQLDETNGEYIKITGQGRSDLVNGEGVLDGLIFSVYTNDSRIYWKKYDEATQTWSAPQILTNGLYVGGLEEEDQPSALATIDGRLFVMWRSHNSTDEYQFWISEYSQSSDSFSAPLALTPSFFGEYRESPKLFEYNSTHIGFVYLVTTVHQLSYAIFPKAYTGVLPTRYWFYFSDYASYYIHSLSITRNQKGDFLLAISARNARFNKPDYDIYVLTFSDFSSISTVSPYQATTSYINQINPDIDYLRNDNDSVVVTYINKEVSYENKIGIVSSHTEGRTWSTEKILNNMYPIITRKDYDNGTIEWYLNGEHKNTTIAYAPAIVGLDGEGFMYDFQYTTQDYSFIILDTVVHIGFFAYAINPQSDWIYNSLTSVSTLSAGDTDGDLRREVICGWDNRISIYEIENTSIETGQERDYSEKWISEAYSNAVNDLCISDFNGNGFEEILVATGRGDVYLLEYRDPSEGTSMLYVPDPQSSLDVDGTSGRFQIINVDFDKDGIDEIIAASKDRNWIMAYKEGTILWNRSLPCEAIYSLAVIDNEDEQRIVISTLNTSTSTGSLIVLDTSTGDWLWNYTYTTYITHPEVLDVNSDGYEEIIVGTNDGAILTFTREGQILYNIKPETGVISLTKTGHFVDKTTFQCAYSDATGHLVIVYLNNGTEVVRTTESIIATVAPGSNIKSYDFNNDGYEELIVGNDTLYIYDAKNNKYFYNCSQEIGTLNFDLLVDDFDGDSKTEIIYLSKNNTVYLIDPYFDRIQWAYEPQNYTLSSIKKVDAGEQDGKKIIDLFISTSEGTVIYFDARTGLVKGVLEEESSIEGLCPFKGSNSGSVFLWDSSNRISYTVFSSAASYTTGRTPLSSITMHELFATQDYSQYGTIEQVIATDLDGDGNDELVVLVNSTTILLVHPRLNAIQWSYVSDNLLTTIKTGDFTEDNILDLLIKDSTGDLTILDGSTGSSLAELSSPTGATEIAVGDVDPEQGDEIVILIEDTSIGVSFVNIYYSNLSLCRQSANFVLGNNHLTLGYFTNTTYQDIVTSTATSAVLINGRTGYLVSTTAISIIPGKIYSARLTNNNYDSVVILGDSQRNFEVIDVVNSVGLYTKTYSGGETVNEIIFADTDPSTSFDELICYTTQGIKIYKDTGAELYSYKLSFNTTFTDTQILASDWDNEAGAEILLSNLNGFIILSPQSQRYLWNYIYDDPNSSGPDFVAIRNIVIGNFSGEEPYEEIVYSIEGTLYYVASTENTPSIYSNSGSSSSGEFVIPLRTQEIICCLFGILGVVVITVKKRIRTHA